MYIVKYLLDLIELVQSALLFNATQIQLCEYVLLGGCKSIKWWYAWLGYMDECKMGADSRVVYCIKT